MAIFRMTVCRERQTLPSLSFKVADVQLNATSPLIVRFSPSEVTFEKTQFTGPGTNIVLGGTLAVGPGGRQSMTADGQLNLRVLNGLSPGCVFFGHSRSCGPSYRHL